MVNFEMLKHLRSTYNFLEICCPNYFVKVGEINKESWNSISPLLNQEFLLFPNSTIGLSLTNGITEE